MKNHAQRRKEARANTGKCFSRAWDRHHSVPKSRQGDVRNYDVYGKHNIVIVPANAHRNYHSFAHNLLPHELAEVLSRCWIDPRCEMIACWKGDPLDDWKRTAGGLLYR
jgi:hypothetical protein